MTLTSAACPLTDVIEDQAHRRSAAARARWPTDVKINWVWMPPWGPDKITDDGREQLRAPRLQRLTRFAVSAYWISIYREIVDPEKVAAYAKLAGPALQAGGGRFLARGVAEQVYEAGEATRTVVLEFPSVQAAREAHDSAAYAEALAALDGGAVRDLRIVPGVD